MTVFVPSNEALRKIPDEELEVIKNNSTALKGESHTLVASSICTYLPVFPYQI